MHPASAEPTLAQVCLAHLEFEKSALLSLRQHLDELHRAILASDFKRVNALITTGSGLADYRDRTDGVRSAFRRSAAESLGLPENQVNLDRIASALPEPWSDRIRQASRSLAEIALNVRKQSQQISTVLACCRAMTRQLLTEIGGVENGVERYSPSGVHLDEWLADTRLVTGTM
jgi:hypothetical protein